MLEIIATLLIIIWVIVFLLSLVQFGKDEVNGDEINIITIEFKSNDTPKESMKNHILFYFIMLFLWPAFVVSLFRKASK